MQDRYEYSRITERSKQFAIDDLGENPSQVNAHIESFRRWVKSMPHLICPTDSEFLLKFLRVSKFDHKKTQKRLDNFCTVRSSPRGSPNFFNYFNVDDPLVDLFLDSMIQLPLGRNDAGEMILLMQTGCWDSEKIPVNKFLILFFMGLDILLAEEETQIHGLTLLIDLKGVSKRAIEAIAEPKLLKQYNMAVQDSYPIRMKKQIFYNEPVIFDVVFQIYSFFMNDKMKGRTHRIKNDISKAFEKIPGIKKVLPTEYSGEGGTLKECAGKWKTRFKAYYKNGNPLKFISVDESKRPSETTSYLIVYKDYVGPVLGTDGTFTKFENGYQLCRFSSQCSGVLKEIFGTCSRSS